MEKIIKIKMIKKIKNSDQPGRFQSLERRNHAYTLLMVPKDPGSDESAPIFIIKGPREKNPFGT